MNQIILYLSHFLIHSWFSCIPLSYTVTFLMIGWGFTNFYIMWHIVPISISMSGKNAWILTNFRQTLTFEYKYKWWRGNCENSPLPTIGSAFQCVKVDLPFCIDVCTCVYILKWFFFFFFLLKKVNIPTFAHWNCCSALPMVEPLCCSERYTNYLSILYMYTQRL